MAMEQLVSFRAEKLFHFEKQNGATKKGYNREEQIPWMSHVTRFNTAINNHTCLVTAAVPRWSRLNTSRGRNALNRLENGLKPTTMSITGDRIKISLNPIPSNHLSYEDYELKSWVLLNSHKESKAASKARKSILYLGTDLNT